MAITSFNARNGLSVGTGSIGVIDSDGNAEVKNLGVTGSITPETSDLYDLGSSTKLWRNLYATTISGSLTGSNVSAGQVVVAGTGGVLSGSNNFWWDNTNQRVGIGTSSLTYKFEVNGGQVRFTETAADSNAVLRLKGSSTSRGGIILAQNSADAAAPLQLYVGTTEALRINTSANVGIGGTNPISRFEVTGSGNTSSTSTMNLLDSSGTSLLFVRDDGNVGIGGTSLQNTGGYKTLSINGSTGGQIAFFTAGTAKQFIYSTGTDLTYSNANGAHIWLGAAGAERSRIDSSGHFVPGTTVTYDIGSNSLRWRDVYARSGSYAGDVTISGNLTVAGTQTIVNSDVVNIKDNIILLNSTATPQQYGGLYVADTTVNTTGSLIWDSNANMWMAGLQGSEAYIPTGSGTTNYVTKWSSASALTNSAIFDNGTYVGIGTTTSLAYKLQVNGSVAVFDGTNGRVVMVPSAGANTGYVEWRNGSATRLGYFGGDSGANLNLTLENSANFYTIGGNVGIGTTSSSARFHVSGSSTASTPTMVVKEGVVSPTGGAGTFDVQNSVGTSVLFVSGSGRVGINSTTPSYNLEVVGNARVSSTFVHLAGDAYLNQSATGNSYFYTRAFFAKQGGVGGGGSNYERLSVTYGNITNEAAGTGTYPNFEINNGGNVRFNIPSSLTSALGVTGSLEPDADNTRDLGSATKRWRNLYAASLSGSLTGSNVSAGQVVVAGTGGVLSGSNDFWWDNSTRRVGIGTASPTARLHVSGSSIGTVSTLLLRHGVAEGASLPVIDAQNSAGTSLFLLSGSGDIRSTGAEHRWTASSGYNIQHTFYNSSATQLGYFGYTGASDILLANKEAFGNINIKTNDTTAIFIRFDGNVGIGSTMAYTDRLLLKGSTSDSTAYALTVRNSSDTSMLQVRNDGIVGIGTTQPFGTNARLNIQLAGTTASGYSAPTNAGLLLDCGTSTNGAISMIGATILGYYFTNSSNEYDGGVEYSSTARSLSLRTAATNRVTVDSSGNVGIGITTMTDKLAVNGSMSVTGSVLPGTDNLYSLGSSAKRWTNVYATSISGSLTGSNVVAGQVVVAGTGGVLSGSNNFWWDNSTQTVGIGTSTLISGRSLTTSNDIDVYGVRVGRGGGGGSTNTVLGAGALATVATRSWTTAIGANAGANIGAASGNTLIGNDAGRYYTGGGSATTNTTSVLIGDNASFFADGTVNEIVIGRSATGIGSNSTVIGSTSTVTTYLAGNVGIGTTNPTSRLTVSGSSDLATFYNSTGTLRTTIQNSGDISFNTSTSIGLVWNTASLKFNGQAIGVQVIPFASNYVGLSVVGKASQTYALQTWQNSSNTVLSLVDANGSVGLGITTISSALNTRLIVSGSSTTSDQTMLVRAGTPSQIGPVFEVENNVGTTLFVVSGSGFVGVGTTNPGYLFTISKDNVNGSVYQLAYVDGQTLGSTSNGTGIVTAYGSNSGFWGAVGGYSNGAPGLGLWAAAASGTPSAYITSVGNVGIGTVQTADKLAVNGSMSVTGSALPGTDNLYNLGSTTKRWANVYATSISGSLTGSNVSAGQVVVAGTGGVLSGSNNFWWDNANTRVGIGTNIPSTSLDILGPTVNIATTIPGDGTAAGSAYFSTSADSLNRVSIGFDNTNSVGFIQAIRSGIGTRNILINPRGGNVGVGTTSISTARLTVSGSTTGTDTTLLVKHGIPNGSSLPVLDVQNSAGTSLLFVTGSGNVGIGTTNPTTRFHVSDNPGNVTSRMHLAHTGGNGGSLRIGYFIDSSGFHITSNGNPAHTNVFSNTITNDYISRESFEMLNVLLGVAGTSYTDFKFGAPNNGSLVRVLRLQSDGSVGIGSTTTIAARLQVSGSSTASTPTMVVREGVTSPTGGVGTFDVQNAAGTSLFFVSGSGNVGIGTTNPVSTGTGLTIYQATNGQLWLQNSSGYSRLVVSSTDLYIDNNVAGSAGSIVFRRGSGTTESARIDASGNVGIGTATPFGAKLAVYGGTLPSGGSGASNLSFASSLSAGRLASGSDTALVNTYFDSSNVEISAGTSSGYVSGIVIAARSSSATTPDSLTFYTRSAERLRIYGASSLVSVSGSIEPGTDVLYSLGSPTKRWANLYANNISGSITGSNLTAGQVVVAGTGGVLSGSTNFWWDDATRRVGIGTSSPTNALHLYAGADAVETAALKIDGATGSVGTGKYIIFPNSNGIGWTNNASGVSGLWMGAGTSTKTLYVGTSGAPAGNVGINTTNPGFTLEVNGTFAATTKSFVIPHPLKDGWKLRYGSLEGPENGIYVRGRADSDTIELPDYWGPLADEASISVQLTPIGKWQSLYVESIENNRVKIGRGWLMKLFGIKPSFFYNVTASRKDATFEVEYSPLGK